MALNFTKAYTFSPSTTAVSGQVNTNFDDIASVFQGLEAETKTLAKLKVDIDPATALEVATKQYVDHLTAYRRPTLQYSSATVVNIETGLTGTSGQAQILFPDGNLRQDSTTGRINCNLAQVAALSGGWQSGLRTGTVAANTWYAIYCVKTSDDTAKFVTVADTVLPLQTNYASLNSNFGTNGWVYLGMIRNGDNSGSTTSIVVFRQSGNYTVFRNECVGGAYNAPGLRLANNSGASSLSYTSTNGTGTTDLPNHCLEGEFGFSCNGGGSVTLIKVSAQTSTTLLYDVAVGGTPQSHRSTGRVYLNLGCTITGNAASGFMDINLRAFSDDVLGVGSNPIL